MTIASKKNVSAKNDTRPIEQPILAPKSLPTHEETAALAAKLLRNLDTALDGITAAERKIPGQGQAIAKSPEKGKDTSKKNEDKNLSSVDEDDIVMDNSEPEGVITAEDAEIDDQGMIKQK